MTPAKYQEVLNMMQKLGKMKMRFVASIGATAREFHALNLLAQMCPEPDGGQPGVKVSELGAAVGMSKPAVSQMLNLLESRGLVERTVARSDRRVVHVRLTESGRERLARLKKSYEATLDRIVDELGPQDTAELLRLFNRLYDIFSRFGGAEEPARDRSAPGAEIGSDEPRE